MRANITVNAHGQANPFLDRPSQRTFGSVMRGFINILLALIGGAGIALRQSLADTTRTANSIEYGTDPAVAGVTVAAPADAATITLNGQALTGHQFRASATVTFASANDGDTVTVNGVVLTAKTSPSGSYQFARGVSNTADAAALAACINALTTASNDAGSAGIFGVVESTSSAAVVTVYAVAEGTAGNSLTLASSNNTRLAVSNATLQNGAAAANNQFDRIGNNIRTARSVCTNLGLSSTGILNQHVTAACRQGTVTCATVVAGDSVTLDSMTFIAEAGATDLSNGGARDTTARDDRFSLANSDNNCAISLANAINAHPRLRERFYATTSGAAVTISERPPEGIHPAPLSSSNGTTLAVTNTVNGCLADSAHVLFQATRPGPSGNAITIASSSGVTLAIDGSASRLAGGLSTVVSNPER